MVQLNTVISSLTGNTIWQLGTFNWIDGLIVAGLIFAAIEGWHIGFIQLLISFFGYAASIWLAIRYHNLIGTYISGLSHISLGWGTVMGYISIVLVCQLVFTFGITVLLRRVIQKISASRFDNWFGIILSVLNACFIIALILLITLALPIRGTIKQDVAASVFARTIVRYAERYGGKVKSSLDDVTSQAIKFLTVKPKSKDTIALEIKPQNWDLYEDEASERQMYELVNAERIKSGTVPLSRDQKLGDVAREYSRDMFQRRYFSHYDPEDHDIVYRLTQAHIAFSQAGENLAYAPEVKTAMDGLLASPAHRENILDPLFGRIGIGIIDAGVFGKMFTQVFTN